MAIQTVTHVVKKGDNLTAITKKYGHPGKSWKKFYNAPFNATFRKKHPDPNTILPGSEFNLPKYTSSEIAMDARITESAISVLTISARDLALRAAVIENLINLIGKTAKLEDKELAKQLSKLTKDLIGKARGGMKAFSAARSRDAFASIFKSAEEHYAGLVKADGAYQKIYAKVRKRKADQARELQKELYEMLKATLEAKDRSMILAGRLGELKKAIDKVAKEL